MKILILIFFSFSVQVFPQSQLPFGIIGNGGEKQISTSYQLVGTIGESSIDQCQNTEHAVQAGFWQMYYNDVLVAVEGEEFLPKEFKLEQNYPNPFNPSTVIKFCMHEQSKVIIKIYDILGSEVITLLNQEMEAGWHEVIFNAGEYSSGVYICRMQGYPTRKGAVNFKSTKKMLMIK